MAVIENVSAVLLSFKVNDANKAFIKNTGTYGTYDILNGGETLSNELVYTFKVIGLANHTINDIIVKSLLLDLYGNLCTNRKLKLELNNKSFTDTFIPSNNVKTIVSTSFTFHEELTENSYIIEFKVISQDLESCYYGLQNLQINLEDVPYSIVFSFSGPNTYRTVSKIDVATLVVKLGSQPVSFSKDPTKDFDLSTDNVEGRMYIRKDGAYVDGFLFAVKSMGTSSKRGIVKTQDVFLLDDEDQIIAPNESGVAASPIMVYNLILGVTDYVLLADTEEERAGKVFLQDTFEVDEEDGGIIAPEGTGIAASPQLVFNALASAKNYVDEQIDKIPKLYTEDNLEINTLIENELVFSNDFLKTNNKLYINWLEIS